MLLASILFPLWFQSVPFADDIEHFKALDRANPPAAHQILFIGSSSFTRWEDVNKAFPGYGILNRAFGGSRLPDVIHFVGDVVAPYHPRQIVIYCGENDLAESPSVTGLDVANRFKTLYFQIRRTYPTVPVLYVSMKPSPSRWSMMAKMTQGNEAIRDFLRDDQFATYVNIVPTMLDESGKPKADIFVGDNLHMNAAGYKLWTAALKPFLLPRR